MTNTETAIDITTRPHRARPHRATKIRNHRRYCRALQRLGTRREIALAENELELEELDADCDMTAWYDDYWLDEWELRGVRRTIMRLAAACRGFHCAEEIFSRVPVAAETAPIDEW